LTGTHRRNAFAPQGTLARKNGAKAMTVRASPRLPPERPASKFGLNLAHWVAGLGAGATSLAIFLGIFPDAIASAEPLNFLLPFIVAPVAGFGLAVSWFFVLGIAAHAEETHRKGLAAALGFALFLIGCGTSAHYLAAIIGGASAIQAYQEDYTGKLKSGGEVVAINAAAEQGLIGAVNASAVAMRSSAASEKDSGLLSGKPGANVVYHTLLNAAESLSKMASSLEKAAHARDEQLTRAARNLAEASHAIATRDAAQFSEAATRAATDIAAAGKINLASMTEGLGIGLIVAEQARADVATTFDQIDKRAAQVSETRRAVSVPVYVPVGAKKAVLTNPPPFAWIASILIEALGLIQLAVLLVLWREERDDAAEQAPPVSVAEPRPRPTLVAVE
jgi:hypothetical protein